MTRVDRHRHITTMECIGDTGSVYYDIESSWIEEKGQWELGRSPSRAASGPNGFKQARFTADGASVVTVSEDCGLRQFVVPPDVLEIKAQLRPFTRRFLSGPITDMAVYPGFRLSDYSTQYLAAAVKNVPVKLYNMGLSDSGDTATYPVWNANREEYPQVYSLAFGSDGSTLYSGLKNKIAMHSVDAPGCEQTVTVVVEGTVSSIAVRVDGVVALGTFEGSLVLVDEGGLPKSTEVRRTGISQVSWSRDGNYVYCLVRKSDQVAIYDVRGSRIAGWLSQFPGQTSQRLYGSPTKTGFLAGGTDGSLHQWPGHNSIQPDIVQPAHEGMLTGL